MTKLYKAALLAALGLASVTAAQAANGQPGDLILGFVNGTQNYVIDLGALPITAGTDFGIAGSGLFSLSTYNSTFTAGGVSVGIVGGQLLGGVGDYIYTTSLRSGVVDTSFGTAGTETVPTKPGTRPNLSNAASLMTAIDLGVQSATAAGSFSSLVAASPTASGLNLTTSYVGYVVQGANPLKDITGNTITLDLWESIRGGSVGAFTYQGDITLNLNTGSLVWDPSVTAVPEPASYGLLAGAGLLVVTLRRQFSRKNA